MKLTLKPCGETSSLFKPQNCHLCSPVNATHPIDTPLGFGLLRYTTTKELSASTSRHRGRRYKRPLSPPRNQKHFRGTETQTSHTLVAPRHCETGHSPLTTQHTKKKPWAESPAASVALAAAVTAAWTTTSGSLLATTSSAPCTSSISLRSATASSSEGESGPPPGDASLRICRTVPLIGPATPRGDIVLSPADGPTVTAFSLASWIA